MVDLDELMPRLEGVRRELESARRHMESADPAGYAEGLLEDVDALITDVRHLRTALEFYGEMGNYHSRSDTLPFHILQESPPGTIARLALAGVYDVMLERWKAQR